jgi:hypothetical protein
MGAVSNSNRKRKNTGEMSVVARNTGKLPYLIKKSTGTQPLWRKSTGKPLLRRETQGSVHLPERNTRNSQQYEIVGTEPSWRLGMCHLYNWHFLVATVHEP